MCVMSDDVQSGYSSLDDEACEWVERFARGQGSRADVAALKRWMARSPAHAEAFDRISRTWTSLETVGQTLAARGLVAPRRRHPAGAAESFSLDRRLFLGGALAASV